MTELVGPELVRGEVRNGAAWILLDSPANRNALSRQLINELQEALTWAADSAEARYVVLGHTGSTFCAGADLAEASSADRSRQPAVLLGQLLRALLAHPKPVVAAVDGHVRAGGMGLVGACDLAVATERASFGLTEVRLGLAASVISVVVAPRLSDRDAACLFLGGSVQSAERMRAVGFLTAVVDDLQTGVTELTAGIVKGSPQGLRESKRVLNQPLLADFDTRMDGLLQLSADLFASDEAREGMAAFLDKREPRWNRG